MVRPLALGKALVTFVHQYDPQIVHNKKTHMSEVIKVPISTTAFVKTDEEENYGKSAPHIGDAFVYEKGRKLALKSCFRKMTTLTKSDRKRVWEEYNKLKSGGRW